MPESESPARPDALLKITRFLLLIALGIVAVAGIAILVATPAIWIFADPIIASVAREGERLDREGLMAITVILIGAMAFVGLAFQFLRKLIALIDSVGVGSPFIPENAARLRYMGWITLAMEGLSIVAVPVAIWAKEALPGDNVHFVAGLSFEGLLTALLLFILARVFDRGVRLEEDMEGTV